MVMVISLCDKISEGSCAEPILLVHDWQKLWAERNSICGGDEDIGGSSR